MTRDLNIGTFNLYNLVLPGVTYYGSKRYSDNKYAQKTAWIGRQLRNMEADVVGFQEAFHTEAIESAIAISEYYPDATVIHTERFNPEDGSPLPMNALVTRFPVINSGYIYDFPTAAQVNYGEQTVPITDFSRPVLQAKLQVRDDLEVHVFVAHLKSKRPLIDDGEDGDDPVIKALGKARALIRRAAEAVALRAVMVDLLKDTNTPAIVLGDLNDSVTAVTTEIMAGSPPWRFLPFEKKKGIWDVMLYNVKDIVARRSYHDVYYTHIYNGHYEALDHLLVSEEFVYENRERQGAVRNVRLFNDHLLDDSLSGSSVEPWQSDHAQVVANIRLEAPEPPADSSEAPLDL